MQALITMYFFLKVGMTCLKNIITNPSMVRVWRLCYKLWEQSKLNNMAMCAMKLGK